ncbi:MacB-like periplasmic core domain protein [uncultured archaeon]|nr:MacB-like periplasmic core domain protein [uncultured archaeon]
MENLEILGLAVNSIRYRNLRSWLAILGVVIGVASIISLISISTGLQDQISSQLSGLGAQIITVSPGGGQAGRVAFGGGGPGGFGSSSSGKPITFKEAEQLRTVAGVQMVDARLSKSATVSYRTRNSTVSVVGTDPSAFLSTSNVQIAEGRSLRSSDKAAAVLGAQVVNRTFQSQDMLDKQIKIDGTPFRVVGILNSTGATFGGSDNEIYIPVDTAKSLFSNYDNASSVVVLAKPSWDPDSVALSLESVLQRLHRVTAEKEDFRVTTASSIQSSVSSVTSTLGLFLGVIASISLIVGGIGVANAMFTSVLEQTKYIGILKSLGATRWDISKLFLFESALVGLVGGLLGIALSYVASSGMSVFGIPTRITIELVALGLFFSVLVGVLSGFFPSRNAASVPPVEALRYE